MTGAAGLQSGRSWIALTALLGVCALAGWFIPRGVIDWQPSLWPGEPWRAFTAVGVHYTGMHLAANIGGLAGIGLLGVAARVPPAATLAWAAAWPLTQIGLMVEPQLARYGGLSGVLHAAVAVIALWLMVRPARRREHAVGAALMLGLLLKVVLEEPWGPLLRAVARWGISVAPLAHASGFVAGLVCAAVALAFTRAPAQLVSPKTSS